MGEKARKDEFIEDLTELAHYMDLIQQYADKAIEILCRPTHILNEDGIADILKISRQSRAYKNASEYFISQVKGGKVSTRGL